VNTVTQVLLVAIGSAIGGLARWQVTVWFAEWFGSGFPWGTLFINLSGSFFLGWFYTVMDQRAALAELFRLSPGDFRLLVATGFTGAYTTFSTFEYETHDMLGKNLRLTAAAYIALSVFLGLVAAQAGAALAGRR
jgi:CrcB protein